MSKINLETLSAKTNNFSSLYPELVASLQKNGEAQKSRNGSTKEFLAFKTIIQNPVQRCTAGNGRDMNIFFLLAESIWIWLGRRDVETIALFNSQMREYSDNKESFNAPYGWRLRYWGADSNNRLSQDEPNYELGDSIDQLAIIVEMLKKNPDDRRAVASIWNPTFDLGKESKDIPCNDTLAFKIRDGKLNLTIFNRSNDIHWGLPTNVFQFSFILEIMAAAVGVGVGTQTHISDSLHVYLKEDGTNEITDRMADEDNTQIGFYELVDASKMFGVSSHKMDDIDFLFGKILDTVENSTFEDFFQHLVVDAMITIKHNPFTACVTGLLTIYADYAREIARNDKTRLQALLKLSRLGQALKLTYNILPHADYVIMAANWFMSRIKPANMAEAQGILHPLFPRFGYTQIFLGEL